MLCDAESSDAESQDRQLSVPRWLRLGALAVSVFGFIEDPVARTLIVLAAGVLALQALAIAACAAVMRRRPAFNGRREAAASGWES